MRTIILSSILIPKYRIGEVDTTMVTNTQIRDFLTDLRKLLEGGWHQGPHFALDYRGRDIHETHPDACSWCLLGGIYRIAHSGNLVEDAQARPIWKAVEDLIGSLVPASTKAHRIICWNETNGRTKEDVLKLIDKGLALCPN